MLEENVVFFHLGHLQVAEDSIKKIQNIYPNTPVSKDLQDACYAIHRAESNMRLLILKKEETNECKT